MASCRIWDLASREQVQPVAALPSGPISISPDRHLVATTDKEGAVWVRDAISDKVLFGPWKFASPVTELHFAPDGVQLLAASEAGARTWNTVTGKTVTPLLPHTGPFQHAGFTPDGSRVAILGQKDQLDVFDGVKGTLQSSHVLPGKGLGDLALTPDGRAAIVVGKAGLGVTLRDVVSGEVKAGLFRQAGLVISAAVSPDGKLLATASADGTAFLWNVATGRLASALPHGQPLHLISFSGDGRRLVTVAEDHTFRVWDVPTGHPVSSMLLFAEPIIQAALSFDGRHLVVRGKSGMILDLGPDARKVDDLVRLTNLLSGETLDRRSGGFEPLESANLRDTWPSLRAKYAKEFTPSP